VPDPTPDPTPDRQPDRGRGGQRRGVIATLVERFAVLPGIGRKTAERLAYHMVRMPPQEVAAFADAVRAVTERLRPCRICFNLAEEATCTICQSPRRDRTLLLVVEQVRDLLAIEEAGSFQGLYHVLQGRLAPLEGIGPEQLTLAGLVARVDEGVIREVIMGTSPTVEGDATAMEVARRLEGRSVSMTRLARGLVVGSPLEQANRQMLTDAISGRHRL
jgi:recombination protein RecR